MSAMAFREPNQVKWVGIRPAHNGEQVAKSNAATNGTTIIHTVTATKTLYLCTSTLTYWGAVGSGQIKVRNAADVDQYILVIGGLITAAGAFFGLSIPFNPPLEIPAGWDVVVLSSIAASVAEGFIFGWEE